VGIRDELREFKELDASMLDRRCELVARARREGMTWREIGVILGMTQQGLIKAHKAWLERTGQMDA
jgi:hypothetical protein